MSQGELDPSHLMQVGMGFWPSKTVLSAVELELFTQLGSESMTAEEIGARLGLHPRGSGSGRPGFSCLGRLPHGTASAGGCHHDGPHPPRLEFGAEDGADQVGL
jgi:hypothetical protein